VELRVLGQEYLTHAARSERATELVMRDPSEGLGHGGMRPAAGDARPRWRGEYTVGCHGPTELTAGHRVSNAAARPEGSSA
jgi:hypothetical protein